MNTTNNKIRKILYVENGIGYGGAIICLRHLVRNLDRTKYEPMVVTGRTGPQYEEIASEARWKYIRDRLVDTVTMKRWLEKSSAVASIPGAGFILGQVIARIDDVGNFLPFFIRFIFTTLIFRPDLIHANNEPMCNRAAIFTGKMLGIPVIAHMRGNIDESKMMRWVYSLPTHFTPVSHWVSDNIGKMGVSEDKRTVVYDGLELDGLDINTDGGQFRKLHNLGEDNFAVGLVGLLIPWKGQRIFLQAAKMLASEIPGLKMLIVGGTPDECASYENELREYVARENLSATVIFTGHVTNMPVVYNGLDVVVSASTSPEPLGTVVIESMAMGRPLIGPNHGGAAEMADHDETALLFEHGSAESLAAAIQRLYDEPELGPRLGKAARVKALKTFAVETHVRNIQAIYAAVLCDKDDVN